MGFFEWISSWFNSNKSRLSGEERREIEALLRRLEVEMRENINSTTSTTENKLRVLISRSADRLQENIDDNKNYFTKEIQRMSDELKKMQEQLDKEKKKKEEKKEDPRDARADNLCKQYEMMLDMMKVLLEQQKSTNSSAGMSSGYPPYSSYPWQQPPAPGTGFSNIPNPMNCHNPIPPNPTFPHNQANFTNPSHNICDNANSNFSGIPSNTMQQPPAPGTGFSNIPNSMNCHNPIPPNPTFPHNQANFTNPSHNICDNANSNFSGIPSNTMANNPYSQNSACCNHLPNQKDSLNQLILPDTRDYQKCGTEHEIKDMSNVSKNLVSSEREHLFKTRSSVELKSEMKNKNCSSLGQLKSDSAKRLILPDTRYYKNCDLNDDPETNQKRYYSGRKKSISKSSENNETQFGYGLILPDSRDYNKLVTASIKKKSEDDKFEKMINDFFHEFPTGSKSIASEDERKQKKTAAVVKKFFSKDSNTKNYSKLPSSKVSSSNDSVTSWLENNENFNADDDGQTSDSSGASVKTDLSKFSCTSSTSKKRVFWNKPQNYGKPASGVGFQGENNNKSFETSNSGTSNYKYTGNQNKNRRMKKVYKSSNSAKKDNADMSTSASNRGKLSEIHYPSKEEADQRGLNLSEPLTRELLFIGKSDDDDWTTHKPKCLNDIYNLEKKYKFYRTIEISKDI